MNEFLFIGGASALWLGILTSISPCPLATNIAAVSFIGNRVGSTRHIFLAGIFYSLGRIITYTGLAVLIVTSLLSIPEISNVLQRYMNKLLGPLLIVTGMIVLELIHLNIGSRGISEGLQRKIEKHSISGALLLGIIFALSFCPVSAGLYFGSLIPLSLNYRSVLFLPALYGIGTALPVLVFTWLLTLGSKVVGTFFNSITRIELWARRITGGVFIGAGIYYSLVYIFHIL